MRTLNNQKRREDICALRKSRYCGTKQNARLVRISHEVILECDASRRRRSAMARRNLRIALSVCPSKHRTPNAELCALGDQRWAMQGFFDRANGGAISASLCSDATSEERMLANAFGSGRFSFERAAVKGGSSSLKTIIIAEGANIRQLPVYNTATPENFRDWRIDR